MTGSLPRPHRVLVFTTPTCPWCTRAKSYLRTRGVPFREIDVSRDPSAARDLVRRTGQMGVPVVEIDGRPIVGFDQAKIDTLLGLRAGPVVHCRPGRHIHTRAPFAPSGEENHRMSTQVQPLGSRVLVRVLPEESVTKSGILLPDTAREKPQRGEVMAIGDDTETIKVSVGDHVLYPRYTGTEIRLEAEDHLIIDSTELLAILRETPAAVAAA